MDKEKLENLIDCGFSQNQLAENFTVCQTTIQYWLKKHNLSTNRKQYNKGWRQELPDRKICSYCKKEKCNSEFHKKTPNQLHSKCKECKTKITKKRRDHFKQQCVDYKGERCQCCGYNACNHALDFHHIDPKVKSFSIGAWTKTKFTQEVLDELDKCVLVCSNCHREIHAGVIKL